LIGPRFTEHFIDFGNCSGKGLNQTEIAMPLLFWMPFVMFTAMCEMFAEDARRMTAPAALPHKAVDLSIVD
jgi:hypothetical protein